MNATDPKTQPPSEPPAFLSATHITAGYGNRDVLSEVNLTLAPGEFVGLLGPNGSGKSTLLRVLSRILKPRQGQVLLDGRDLWTWTTRETALRMAFVPQQETIGFPFTVQDTALMGRYAHRRGTLGGEQAQDYAIVQQALAMTDALHLADRPITTLSGGEHRRVLMARALAQQTPLLLLDEPTAYLDIAHQMELMRLVARLCSFHHVGALAALHDLNQAAEFCTRLVLMREGQIIADGTPETVLTAPHLRRAYDAEVHIGTNPVTGRPMLFHVAPLRDYPD